MIHSIQKPKISPDFTIEDIHKIREWNYERLKDATLEERLAVIHSRAAAGKKEMVLLAKRDLNVLKTP
jgi:hypothetical protein